MEFIGGLIAKRIKSMANTEDRGETVVYEIGYLVLPSIPEENVSNVVDSIKKIVEKNSGKEIDSEAPHKRNLAYPMSKVVGASKYVATDAYVGWIKFEVEPEKIGDIKSEVEALNEILRFLLIKAPRETMFTFASVKNLNEASDQTEESAEESDEGEESLDEDSDSEIDEDDVVE